MVKAWPLLAASCVAVVAGTTPAQRAPRYALPAPVVALVEDGRGFRDFTAALERDTEAALDGMVPPAEELRRWLGLRVHLALLSGDDARAQAAAGRLRELQSDPAERAYTGVTTQALGAARRAGGGVDPAAFGREFARRLAELPRTAAMRGVLVRQRERVAGITAESVRAEASALAARVGTAQDVDLATADEIVRLRHRLKDLVPLRAVTVTALDVAIAERG
jgi:hypothetical protein